jgi:hypothetical protein
MHRRAATTESLPATAVVRASRATFDPSRFAEVDAMNTKTSEYLIPAVKQLPGLIHFYAGVSPGGSVNGQFVVPAGGQVKVPGPGVVQLFVAGLVPFVRAWRMR